MFAVWALILSSIDCSAQLNSNPWIEVERNNHFVVWRTEAISPPSKSELGKFLVNLERARIWLDGLFQIEPSRQVIEIVLTESSQIAKISGMQNSFLSAWVDRKFNFEYQRKVIFIDSHDRFDLFTVHRLVHEMHHLLSPSGETLWIEEGLSEYLASRFSGLKPTRAIQFFLDNHQPLGYLDPNQNNLNQFGLGHYGHAYLFFKYLESRYGSYRWLTELMQSTRSGIPGLMRALAMSYPKFDQSFAEIYSSFLQSLAYCGPTSSPHLELNPSTQGLIPALGGFTYVKTQLSTDWIETQGGAQVSWIQGTSDRCALILNLTDRPLTYTVHGSTQ